MKFINYLFRSSEKYEGIRPIQVYIMKLFFALMFLFAAKDAWGKLLFHEGSWEAETAIAWSAMAAYTTLSCLGIFNTLRMLPIMLFMVFYKGIWLLVVAFPLWKTNALNGSPNEEFTYIFMWGIIPALFFPWRYFYRHYIVSIKK